MGREASGAPRRGKALAGARKEWNREEPPMLTCEPVLTEVAFTLKREVVETDAIFTPIKRGIIRAALHVEGERADLRALIRRYRDRPMSLADACLMRLSGCILAPNHSALTRIIAPLRRQGNKTIPLLMPEV